MLHVERSILILDAEDLLTLIQSLGVETLPDSSVTISIQEDGTCDTFFRLDEICLVVQLENEKIAQRPDVLPMPAPQEATLF